MSRKVIGVIVSFMLSVTIFSLYMFFYEKCNVFVSPFIFIVASRAFLDWKLKVFGKYENPLSGMTLKNRIVKWDRSVPTLFFSAHPLYVLCLCLKYSEKLRTAVITANTPAEGNVFKVKPSMGPFLFRRDNQPTKVSNEELNVV